MNTSETIANAPIIELRSTQPIEEAKTFGVSYEIQLGVDARMTDLVFAVPASAPVPLTAEITTFAPEPYSPRGPIKICLTPEGDQFVASHKESNVHASGETEFEAIENLKSLMLDLYDCLEAEPADKLGPKAQNQLAMLQSLIERN